MVRHSALDLIPVELAGRVAVGNPCSLHGACLDRLFVIERVEQTLLVLVQQIVPNRSLNFVAIGQFAVGSGTHIANASICNKAEQALPFTLVDIVFVLVDAILDCRDFMCRRFATLRMAQVGNEARG